MSTFQIAQRLVRSFGEGNNFRQVVTETIGKGKTLTKVLDKDGNLITERLKYIAPKEKVGDKFVITTTKVMKGKYDGQRLACVHKDVTNRVYNEAGQKLGERTKSWNEDDGLLSKNVIAGAKKMITTYEEGIRNYMRKYFDKNFLNYAHIDCNAKGLPKPRLNVQGKDLSDSTLKDMRLAFQEKYPGERYAYREFSLSSLDEHVPEMKLTDLDKYI